MSAGNQRDWRLAYLPAMPRPAKPEVLKAGFGGFLGIGACLLLVNCMNSFGFLHLFLVAPLGATAVLVFAVPNSPLAQPWSAIAGNSIASACGVAAIAVAEPQFAPVLAVTLAFAGMMIGRALHPPGGAVALLIGLSPDLAGQGGYLSVCANVSILTFALVQVGIVFHLFSGRNYPFRTSLSQSASTAPRRLDLDKGELTDLLTKFHQSANLGAVDLARLLAAAEEEVIHHRFDGQFCGDLVTYKGASVGTDAPLREIVRQLRNWEPPIVAVTHPDGTLAGILKQKDVLAQLVVSNGFRRLTPQVRARSLMVEPKLVLDFDMPLGEAITLLLRDNGDAAAVLKSGRFMGLLTRSGLLDAVLPAGAEQVAA